MTVTVSSAPTSPKPKPAWEDRWQRPNLKDPKPVVAASGPGGFGFGSQLVMTSQVSLGVSTQAKEVFAAAKAPGSTVAVLGTNVFRKGFEFTIGQAELGNVGATGDPDVDWYEPGLQPDLTNAAESYRHLQNLNWAPNALGLVKGDAAYLPILGHSSTASKSAPGTDLVKGMTNLGSDLFIGGGITATSIQAALTSAQLLSRESGQAFAVTTGEPHSTAVPSHKFLIAPISELTASYLPSRATNPPARYSLNRFQLDPGTSVFTRNFSSFDPSLIAIVDDTVMAVVPKRHEAVGNTGIG